MTVYGIFHRAFAPHLTWYSAGDLVCINYGTHTAEAEAAANEIVAKGGRVIAIQGDIGSHPKTVPGVDRRGRRRDGHHLPDLRGL